MTEERTDRERESGDAERDAPAATPRPETPRWVKLFGAGVVAVALLAVAVMLISGGNHGPGRHVPPVGVSISPSPTGHDVGDVGAPADSGEADRTVTVRALDSMAYEPASVEVAAGETVTFVVTNAGQAVHEFTLGDAAMQHQHAAEMSDMPHGIPHDRPNSITLQPGETKQLTWRFGHAATLEYACHEPGHLEAGMRGQISVH
jgi:uncharacterized cupredoxin-like copper-binding protein